MTRFSFVLLLSLLWKGWLTRTVASFTGVCSTPSFALREKTLSARRFPGCPPLWAVLPPDDGLQQQRPKKAPVVYSPKDFTQSKFETIMKKSRVLKDFQSCLQKHVESMAPGKDKDRLALLLQKVDAQRQILRKENKQARNKSKLKRDTKAADDGVLPLNCLIVNDGSVISVKIKEDENVAELKKAIKGENQYSFPAVKLQLWKVQGLQVTRKKNVYTFKGRTLTFNQDFRKEFATEDDDELVAGLPISSYFSREDDIELGGGFIHVLVKLPHVENIDLTMGSNRDKRQNLEGTTVNVTTPFDVVLHPFITTADATNTPQVKSLEGLTSISDFIEIRENGLYYVDKTKVVLDLVNKEKHVFLSRPRRFGKTLTVSVLENLFLGRKDLFTGLYAEENWIWAKKSPVLRFDFSGMNAKTFETELLKVILDLSSDWSFQNPDKDPTIKSALGKLVKHLRNTYGPCVILVDEYDKPVLDAFDLDPKEIEVVARHNRNILKYFFETIKALGGMIRFSFVTGSSRLAKAAMFSGDNARKDISFAAAYDAICGFTEAEIIPLLDQSKLELMDLQSMYNGYQFGGDSWVYNPFGIVNALAEGVIKCYWTESGSLSNSLLKFSAPREIFDILDKLAEHENGYPIDELDVTKSISLEVLLQKKVPLIQLLLQAGYLTLRIETGIWSVHIPNKEVRMRAIPELFWLVVPETINATTFADTISKAVRENDMKALYEAAYKLLASIGYPNKVNESYYRTLLQVAFSSAKGVDCQVEIQTSCGNSDLTLTTSTSKASTSCRIIIELKLVDPQKYDRDQIHKIARKALEQARGYALEQEANLIAGWLVNMETKTLFDLERYGDECHQFEILVGRQRKG